MAKYTIDNQAQSIDFECNDDIVQRTLNNCKNLIMCRMGEIPYDRKRGLNPALFDLPIEKMNEIILPEVDRALGWEPDARAVDAKATMTKKGETLITVTVEVNL